MKEQRPKIKFIPAEANSSPREIYLFYHLKHQHIQKAHCLQYLIPATFTMPETTTVKSCMKRESSYREVNFVEFDGLVIYKFCYELGEHPSVSDGPPLTIGWEHDGKNATTVDYYEHLRKNRPRRSRKELMMSKSERKQILSDLGYSDAVISQASQEAKIIRKSRLNNIKDAGILGTINEGFRAVIERSRKAGQPRIMSAHTA
jgi:hypothetical protein